MAWFAARTGSRALSTAEQVRVSEHRKRAAGLKELRIWVPDSARAIAEVRTLAAKLVEQHSLGAFAGMPSPTEDDGLVAAGAGAETAP